MKRINIFCGPGGGKSTVAAWLFYYLKSLGQNVELVNEWIKTWAWQGIKPAGYDQFYICAKQLRKEDIVLRNDGIIVSDSPLLMQLAYVKKYQSPDSPIYDSFNKLEEHFEMRYPSINIMLTRHPDFKYDQAGRYETREEAKYMDFLIHQELESRYRVHEHFYPHQLMEMSDYVMEKLYEDRKELRGNYEPV